MSTTIRIRYQSDRRVPRNDGVGKKKVTFGKTNIQTYEVDNFKPKTQKSILE
eukprot:COSAG01_NODE_75682_length_193_cov_400.872340_1_plen_51_part_01